MTPHFYLDENDVTATILELMPDPPQDASLEDMKDWTWDYVYRMKKAIVRHEDDELYTPDNFKRAYVTTLKGLRLSFGARKALVHSYNQALGNSKFAPDWPVQIATTVQGLLDDGVLPLPTSSVFKRRSPHYPKLLAAIYMAGADGHGFIFGMNCYAQLFGCSPAVIHKLIHKLDKMDYLTVLTQGRFAYNTRGKESWYELPNPQGFLNLFQFSSLENQGLFLRAVNSLENPYATIDWDEFVITRPWLTTNLLL